MGKAETVRQGRDIALISIGSTVAPSLEAAEDLALQGVDATVINARFAKPVDTELILHVGKRIKKVVTVEENMLSGGFGAAVLELLTEGVDSGVRVKRLGIPDEFVTHGKQEFLRSLYHLDARGIAAECIDFLARLKAEAQIES
jgi:1-deoxy-D-xylulose-5-phosphate synthase